MRDPSGQSTLEYLALVLLASIVLAVGAAAASSTASGLPASVVAQFARGLCLVRAGVCERDRAPCVVTARTTSDDVAVRVAFLRIGGGRTVTRERLSDGRVRVTVLSRGAAGLGVVLGGGLRIGGMSARGRVEASADLRAGHGRTWVVGGERAADELLRGLVSGASSVRRVAVRRPPTAAVPQPDVVLADRGLDTALAVGLGRLGLGFEVEDLRGTRTDRRTGERTLLLRRRSEGWGAVSLIGRSGGRAGRRLDERWALVTDARGRPLDLVVTDLRRVEAGVRLPGPLSTLAARSGRPLSRGRLVERERHLDLTEPAALAAAGAFLRELRSAAPRAAARYELSAALRARFALGAVEHTRVYDIEVTRTGAGADVGVGPGLGGGYEHVVESARLLGATVRDPLAGERRREDCR